MLRKLLDKNKTAKSVKKLKGRIESHGSLCKR